ncbi:exo-alpha-sialidase [Arcanobacterium ihumii]|uniref:exo-alpha-sialidase n=1 Tax=Arcanobacterium ihumii TaxID=2138162 RepID=UPI000F52BD03|nr:exo-alpha-sialidase [Arcanobacterium ihumii]
MRILFSFKDEACFTKAEKWSVLRPKANALVALAAALGLVLAPATVANAEEISPSSDAVATVSPAVPQPVGTSETQPLVAPKATGQNFLQVELKRTDTLGDKVYVGDLLTFTVKYVNVSNVTFTAYPAESNLNNVLVGDTKNCRWGSLNPNDSKTCPFAQHRVTEEDLKTGFFAPHTVWKATKDREGTQVLQDRIVADSPIVSVVVGDRPKLVDPATIFTNRADGEPVVLATAYSAGFNCHRIPALTTAPNGWILAAWDGRPGNCGDAPQSNSILQRISKDGGKSWSAINTIAAGKSGGSNFYGYSDPSYVVDRETNTIHMFFVKSFDTGFAYSQTGVEETNRKVLHAATMMSKDNGETWTQPRVITKEITNDLAISSRFAASGEGIQLKYGAHKGRLIQQYTVRKEGRNQAVSVFSDDHGVTWHSGIPFGTDMDENKVVELSDGSVMLNSRSSDGSTHARKIGISRDGGKTYTDFHADQTLIDPNNNGAITRAYPNAPEGSDQAKILLFTNAASKTTREKGTLRISYDDGKTWSASKMFEPNRMDYSTITPLPTPGTYGILYEPHDGTAPVTDYQIKYMQVSLEWLGALAVKAESPMNVVHRGNAEITLKLTNLGSAVDGLKIIPELPQGWAASSIAPISLGAGVTTTVKLPITVSGKANPGKTSIPVTVKAGTRSMQLKAEVEVRLYRDEKGVAPIRPTLKTPLPEELVNENGAFMNVFDGNQATMWHTPWADKIKLPLDIDLTIPKKISEVRTLSFFNRSDAPNGRIGKYEVYMGTNESDLVKVGSGEAPNAGGEVAVVLDKKPEVSPVGNLDAPLRPTLERTAFVRNIGVLSLAGSTTLENTPSNKLVETVDSDSTFVRIRILSTYGNQVDTFASLTELMLYVDVYGTDAREAVSNVTPGAGSKIVPPTPVLSDEVNAQTTRMNLKVSELANTGSNLGLAPALVILFLSAGMGIIVVHKWKGVRQ